MQKYWGGLLEELDRAYPYNLSLDDLIKRGYDKGIVIKMSGSQIINHTPDFSKINLSASGFLMLNQIRIKKATDKLNESIERFSDKNEKSSKELNKYTKILTGATIALVIITVIQILLLFK